MMADSTYRLDRSQKLGERLNETALKRATWRQRFVCYLLTAPGLLLIATVLVVPVAWLFWLSAFDAAGQLTWANYERMLSSVYINTFLTTFRIAGIVTLVCALIGYPVAYMMAQAKSRMATVIMVAVMLPFWTSVLVRTYAWLVLLQRTGLINSTLLNIGIIDTPLPLVHNELGTIIGMVHVMLPFMILPLYASMKAIDSSLVLAAANCGASPAQAFRQVYFPQTITGLSSGAGIIFVLCLGFFVTPVLLGGGRTYMWAMQIADNISLYGNWGAATALGVVLVVATALVLLALRLVLRLAGGQR